MDLFLTCFPFTNIAPVQALSTFFLCAGCILLSAMVSDFYLYMPVVLLLVIFISFPTI